MKVSDVQVGNEFSIRLVKAHTSANWDGVKTVDGTFQFTIPRSTEIEQIYSSKLKVGDVVHDSGVESGSKYKILCIAGNTAFVENREVPNSYYMRDLRFLTRCWKN